MYAKIVQVESTQTLHKQPANPFASHVLLANTPPQRALHLSMLAFLAREERTPINLLPRPQTIASHARLGHHQRMVRSHVLRASRANIQVREETLVLIAALGNITIRLVKALSRHV